jgi:hypothetical protein
MFHQGHLYLATLNLNLQKFETIEFISTIQNIQYLYFQGLKLTSITLLHVSRQANLGGTSSFYLLFPLIKCNQQ